MMDIIGVELTGQTKPDFDALLRMAVESQNREMYIQAKYYEVAAAELLLTKGIIDNEWFLNFVNYTDLGA